MNSEMYEILVKAQQTLCEKYGAEYLRLDLASKLGVSENAIEGILPIHGLRHRPKGDTSGWYIWSGEYSEDPNLFEALHAEHAFSETTTFSRYLGLAPGWRFLIGENGYEDVWFDPGLLDE